MISFGIMKFGSLLIVTHSAIVLLYHGYGNQYIIVKEKADAIYIRRIWPIAHAEGFIIYTKRMFVHHRFPLSISHTIRLVYLCSGSDSLFIK